MSVYLCTYFHFNVLAFIFGYSHSIYCIPICCMSYSQSYRLQR